MRASAWSLKTNVRVPLLFAVPARLKAIWRHAPAQGAALRLVSLALKWGSLDSFEVVDTQGGMPSLPFTPEVLMMLKAAGKDGLLGKGVDKLRLEDVDGIPVAPEERGSILTVLGNCFDSRLLSEGAQTAEWKALHPGAPRDDTARHPLFSHVDDLLASKGLGVLQLTTANRSAAWTGPGTLDILYGDYTTKDVFRLEAGVADKGPFKEWMHELSLDRPRFFRVAPVPEAPVPVVQASVDF